MRLTFDVDPSADIARLGQSEQHLLLVVRDGAIKRDRRLQ